MSVIRTLEFEDEQEYKLFMSALTQAGSAYGDVGRSACFGLEIPAYLEEFYNKKGITNRYEIGECIKERILEIKAVIRQLDDQTLAEATKEYNRQFN